MDYFLLFNDSKDGELLGGVIISDIHGPIDTDSGFLHAVKQSWKLGLNPGGAVRGGCYRGPGPRDEFLLPSELLHFGLIGRDDA